SSRADHLPRPIAPLSRVAVALDDWGRVHVGKGPRGFEGMCVNVAKLDGGIAFNVVPDAAHLTVSLRPPPGSDLTAVERELEALAKIPVTWSLENPPFH